MPYRGHVFYFPHFRGFLVSLEEMAMGQELTELTAFHCGVAGGLRGIGLEACAFPRSLSFRENIVIVDRRVTGVRVWSAFFDGKLLVGCPSSLYIEASFEVEDFGLFENIRNFVDGVRCGWLGIDGYRDARLEVGDMIVNWVRSTPGWEFIYENKLFGVGFLPGNGDK